MFKYIKDSFVAYVISIAPLFLEFGILSVLLSFKLIPDDTGLFTFGLIFAIYFFFVQPLVFSIVFLRLHNGFFPTLFSKIKLYVFSYVVFFLLNTVIGFYFFKLTGKTDLSFISPVEATIFFGGRYVIFAVLLYLLAI